MVLHYVCIVIVSVCYCFSGYHDTNCIQVICIFVKVIVFGPILSGLLKSWPACEGADKAMFSFAAFHSLLNGQPMVNMIYCWWDVMMEL